MSSNHRLSLVVVGVITTSCCGVTAVVTLGVVVVVIRYRRRHDVASSHRREKSATVTPLITAFRPAHLTSTAAADHRVHLSAPTRLLPDVARCDSDADEHQYDVLETGSAFFWPGGGGSMPAGMRPAVVGGSCRCSSCLLASASRGSRLCGSGVMRQTVSDRC